MASKRNVNNRPGSSVSEHHNASFVGDPMSSQVYLHGDKAGQQKNQNFIKRIINVLWATRQTQDTTNNSELLIRTTLKELIIYVVYLTVITIVTFGMTNPINYYYTNIMMNLFLKSPSSPAAGGEGVTFADVGSMNDFWDVMQGPIIEGLYNGETWYNGEAASQQNFIYFENKLLGVPRLRQLRVRKNSCKVHPLFKNTISECYDTYSYFSEDKSPFGSFSGNQTSTSDPAFYYQDSSVVQAPIVSGQISTYGGGGYVQNLALTKSDSNVTLNYLKNYTWIDRGTRVVFLDFTIYNGNINMFCEIRLITEFPSTGGAIGSWDFRTVKLIRYVTPMDYFVLACEIIFVIFIVYYSIEESLEIRIHKLKYFKEVWNCLDVVIIIISYICIGFNIYRVIKVGQVLDSLLVNQNQYPEFDSLSYWQLQFNNAIAITAFLSWIKIFKYISFNKTMNQLSSTLGRCAKDIMGFSVMFFIVFLAYAQLGYLMFGSNIPDYSTFTTTMFTLYRIILGDFDFPTLEASYKVMGPIYFLSYVFFVFFVLLNMFLAIINDTYSDVKSDIANSDSEFEIGQYFKRGYDKILTKMNLKKDKIADIQKVLEEEKNKGGVMDFDKWRTELRNRGYTEIEIEAFFAKYDTDGNRNLSHEEQEQMRNDLRQESEALDKEMNQFKSDSQFNDEYSQEELDRREAERKANMVSHEEFRILTARVDTMESSIGNIVNRIDGVLNKLESIERAKLKRREAMAKILDKLNEANAANDDLKRIQIQKMVKDELDRWDEPLSVTPTSGGYISRAASPSSDDIGKRNNGWPQF